MGLSDVNDFLRWVLGRADGPSFAMQISERVFTARFAKGAESAESAEMNDFSIAVDPG